MWCSGARPRTSNASSGAWTAWRRTCVARRPGSRSDGIWRHFGTGSTSHSTRAGAIGFLGEMVGGGTCDSLLPDAEAVHVFGVECLCLGLDRLIQVKRAAGRPKDLEAIAELEAIRDERRCVPES